jgi:hypothetical protein
MMLPPAPKKKHTGWKITGLVILGLIIAGGLTGQDEPRSTPAVSDSGSHIEQVAELAWDVQTPSDQQAVCTLIDVDREAALDAFLEGADGAFTYSETEQILSYIEREHC